MTGLVLGPSPKKIIDDVGFQLKLSLCDTAMPKAGLSCGAAQVYGDSMATVAAEWVASYI